MSILANSPLDTARSSASEAQRVQVIPLNQPPRHLPMNSLARYNALCNPSYHSGNSFFSFKPPMISFITSSHSSARQREGETIVTSAPCATSTSYPNRCFHRCWRHRRRTNPRSTFESAAPGVCAGPSVVRSFEHLLARRSTSRTRNNIFEPPAQIIRRRGQTSMAASKSVQLTRPSLFVSGMPACRTTQ